jgi:hypothetical protein
MQTYTVAAYRPGETPTFRNLGSGLTFETAIRRIMLSAKIWPHLGQAKAYGEQLGEIDVVSIGIKLQ